jgi:hypothetical protein
MLHEGKRKSHTDQQLLVYIVSRSRAKLVQQSSTARRDDVCSAYSSRFEKEPQIERNVNLRLRIILKTLVAGAMDRTRPCNRPIDMDGGIGR